MLGRKRLKDGEHITLYVKDKTETDFEKYLKHTEQILRNIKRSRHFTPDFENELIQKEFIGERYFSYDPRCGRHLANPYSDYYLGRKAIEYVKIKHQLHRNANAFREQICEWLGVMYEVDNPAKADLTANDEDMELLSIIRKETEAIIKPYAEEKRKISKDDTAGLVAKVISFLELHKIKRKSGIRTRKDHHMDNLNSILNFFAEKGFDKYELSGKENYTVDFIPKGNKTAADPIEPEEENTGTSGFSEEMQNDNDYDAIDSRDKYDDDEDYDEDYDENYYEDYDDDYDDGSPRYGDYDYPYDDYQDASDQDE